MNKEALKICIDSIDDYYYYEQCILIEIISLFL